MCLPGCAGVQLSTGRRPSRRFCPTPPSPLEISAIAPNERTRSTRDASVPLFSPINNDGGTKWEPAAFGAIDRKAALGKRLGRDHAAQSQRTVRSLAGDLLDHVIFGKGMN